MDREFRDVFERARDGDPAALDDLLARHYQGLRAFVRLKSGQLIRAREASTDLVQSVCREVLRGIRDTDCDDEGAFRHWLYTVTLNKILQKKEYHVAQKRDAARATALDEAGGPALLASYAGLCTPSREVAAREEVQRVEAAFDRLPDEYRDVIIQSRLIGRSHREIADDLGKNEAAVRKLLSRARARLAMLLTAE